MIRSIFTIAAVALSSATLATSAEACISCEYVPEVVRQHATVPDAPAYRSRGYADRSARGARQRKVAKENHRDAKPLKTAKAEKSSRSGRADGHGKTGQRTLASKASRPSEEIKVRSAPSRGDPVVARVGNGFSAEAVADTRAGPKRIESESSSIALSAVKVAQERVSAVAMSLYESAGKPTDCKKFFPSVAMTLTVPCE